jgi:hypothetical protein
MTELFTMIVLTANVIVASAVAKFASPAFTDAATAHEQLSGADTFEGRVLAKSRVRNAPSALSRDLEDPATAYWG